MKWFNFVATKTNNTMIVFNPYFTKKRKYKPKNVEVVVLLLAFVFVIVFGIMMAIEFI